MNYEKLIKKIGKYHFLLVAKNKVVVFSSNNTLKQAKKETLEKIKSKLTSLRNKYIVQIKLKKVKEEDIEENKKSDLKFIGGVVQANVKIYKINDKGELVKDDETMSSRVYFTEKYLKENKEISKKDLKKIAYYAMTGKLKTNLMAINTMEEINKVKKEEPKKKEKPKKNPKPEQTKAKKEKKKAQRRD